MLRLGLTGGIGSGKSLVSRVLVSLGAVVIDADVVAREVVEPGTSGLAAVVEAFGPAVLQPDGSLDREALGRVVFGDDEARARLSGILHPLIGARSAELWAAAEQAGAEVLVHDVPLLVENHLEAMYDEVLVVDAPRDVQLDRLVRMRGMPLADAEQRIAAQAAPEVRLAAATRVLRNDGTVAELEAKVRALWDELTAPQM